MVVTVPLVRLERQHCPQHLQPISTQWLEQSKCVSSSCLCSQDGFELAEYLGEGQSRLRCAKTGTVPGVLSFFAFKLEKDDLVRDTQGSREHKAMLEAARGINPSLKVEFPGGTRQLSLQPPNHAIHQKCLS